MVNLNFVEKAILDKYGFQKKVPHHDDSLMTSNITLDYRNADDEPTVERQDRQDKQERSERRESAEMLSTYVGFRREITLSTVAESFSGHLCHGSYSSSMRNYAIEPATFTDQTCMMPEKRYGNDFLSHIPDFETCSSPKVRCTDRLYDLSWQRQVDGRKRRDAIAQASLERNIIPRSRDFGVLPVHKNEEKYRSGMEYLSAKTAWISEELKRKSEAQRRSHEFKLAKGAFYQVSQPKCAKQTLDSSKNTELYERGEKYLAEKRLKIQALRLQADTKCTKSPSDRLNNRKQF